MDFDFRSFAFGNFILIILFQFAIYISAFYGMIFQDKVNGNIHSYEGGMIDGA